MTTLKTCSVCKKPKRVTEFNKHKTKPDGLQSLCKECSKIRSRKYYKNNHDKHRKAVSIRNKAVIIRNRSKLNAIKSLGCTTCPESDECCIDFHHVDPSIKDKTISRLCNGGYTWPQIQAELKKCIRVCSNCHRKLHRDLRIKA